MSLAKKYLNKALIAQKENEQRVKKTERIAKDRFGYVLVLISGASGAGKTQLDFASPGVKGLDSGPYQEQQEIFESIAKKLRLEGFEVTVSAKYDKSVDKWSVNLAIDWTNATGEEDE